MWINFSHFLYHVGMARTAVVYLYRTNANVMTWSTFIYRNRCQNDWVSEIFERGMCMCPVYITYYYALCPHKFKINFENDRRLGSSFEILNLVARVDHEESVRLLLPSSIVICHSFVLFITRGCVGVLSSSRHCQQQNICIPSLQSPL